MTRGVIGHGGVMDIASRVTRQGGIVHRQQLLDDGVPLRALRAALTRGDVVRVRRYWVATGSAPPLLLEAARASGRLACVSAAVHRGWWMPEGAATKAHLVVPPDAKLPPGTTAFIHWSAPLVPQPPHRLIESVPDTLEHVAACLPFEQALVVWESACAHEHVHPEALTRIRWRTGRSRRLSATAHGRSDSGLETLFVVRLAPWGVVIRQQVMIAGHDVDVLVGERLVVQLDGFAFHSTPADHQRDVTHDRELRARGYTVLRFTYRDVVTEWERVERVIVQHLAQGNHLAD